MRISPLSFYGQLPYLSRYTDGWQSILVLNDDAASRAFDAISIVVLCFVSLLMVPNPNKVNTV